MQAATVFDCEEQQDRARSDERAREGEGSRGVCPGANAERGGRDEKADDDDRDDAATTR